MELIGWNLWDQNLLFSGKQIFYSNIQTGKFMRMV